MSEATTIKTKLPKEWKVRKLGGPDVAQLIMGQSPPSHTYNTQQIGLPFFQGKADFGQLYPSAQKWCSSPLKVARKNDVLISVRAPVGDVNLSNIDCCIGRGLAAIRGQKSVNTAYIFFYLWAHKNDIEHLGTGTTFKSINKQVLHNFQIIFPPLPTQKKITAVLFKIQRAIEMQEKNLRSLCDLKKSTMQFIFTHGLRGEKTKITEIGEIPESWEMVRFIDFAVLQRGFDITKREQLPGKVPVVSSGGTSSYHNKAKCNGPGVIIGRKGSLGTVHYVKGDYWPHDTTLWIKDFKGNNPLYVYWFLQTLKLERFDSGASNPTLNRNTVHKELIAMPNLKEQTAIAECLASVSKKINFHKSKKAALQDLFQTILNKLMSGEIRVKDLVININEVSYE